MSNENTQIAQFRPGSFPATIMHGPNTGLGQHYPLSLISMVAAGSGRGHSVGDAIVLQADNACMMKDLIGDGGRVELAIAVTMFYIFPVSKRGLRQSLACAVVPVDVD